MRRTLLVFWALGLGSLVACFDFDGAYDVYCQTPGRCDDGGPSVAADAGDAAHPTDSGSDGGKDAGATGVDAGAWDGGDGGWDAGVDAGADGGADGGADAGGDGGLGNDAGLACDASLCLVQAYPAPVRALWGIAASGAGEIWAFGPGGQVVHWDGASWTTEVVGSSSDDMRCGASTPNGIYAGGESGIFEKRLDGGWSLIHDKAPDEIIALHSTSAGELLATGSLHWIGRGSLAGSSWTFSDELRLTSGTLGSLRDVMGRYAVGQGLDFEDRVYRRDPTSQTWAVDLLPAIAGDLEAVWALNAEEAFAVGSSGSVVRRRADAGWSSVSAFTAAELEDVWSSGSVSDVWVVGWGGEVWHFDGSGWARQTPPGVTSSFDFYGVAGNGVSDLYLLANYRTAGGTGLDRFDGGWVFHYRRP